MPLKLFAKVRIAAPGIPPGAEGRRDDHAREIVAELRNVLRGSVGAEDLPHELPISVEAVVRAPGMGGGEAEPGVRGAGEDLVDLRGRQRPEIRFRSLDRRRRGDQL